jgi:hypothetical protein
MTGPPVRKQSPEVMDAADFNLGIASRHASYRQFAAAMTRITSSINTSNF